MAPYIKEVRNRLQDICKKLLRDIPDIRIGIIAHGDYWCVLSAREIYRTFPFYSSLHFSARSIHRNSRFMRLFIFISDAVPSSYVLKRIDLSNDVNAILRFVDTCHDTGMLLHHYDC